MNFLPVLEARSPGSSFPPIWFLGRTFFLVCRWLPSHYAMSLCGLSSVWLCRERERERERERSVLALPVLIKTPILSDLGPTLMTSLNFLYLLISPVSKYSRMGLRAQQMNFEGMQTFSLQHYSFL